MPYLLNAWYVAAWAGEIETEMFVRTLLDVRVVMFRDADGRVVAMHDLCPHRFAPLSMGVLAGDRVRCGYHGLEFDFSGQCVGTSNPYPVPKAIKVRVFPTLEQDGIVWIWMGDKTPTDPDGLLRFDTFNDPAWRSAFGVMLTKIDYRLYIDNLLDLTHTTVMHPVFGGMNYQPKFKSWEEGDDVVSEYRTEAPSSMIAGDTPVVGVDLIRWRPPGAHRLMTSVTPVDPAFPAHEFPAAHIVTPETRFTTHYFWGASVRAESPMTNEQLSSSLRQAFENEDKPILEAVQRSMGDRDLFDMKPLLLPVDASGVRARRKLATLIDLEAAARSGQSDSARGGSREA